MSACSRDGAILTPRPGDASPAHRPRPSPPAAAPDGKAPAKTNPLAGCQLCHVDVEDEYVKSRHFRENVACVKCHGPSRKHA
ncbi:hypothetical protein HQ560_15390, partial [bacterium]|nr:hypothetical protein [bacterium]